MRRRETRARRRGSVGRERVRSSTTLMRRRRRRSRHRVARSGRRSIARARALLFFADGGRSACRPGSSGRAPRWAARRPSSTAGRRTRATRPSARRRCARRRRAGRCASSRASRPPTRSTCARRRSWSSSSSTLRSVVPRSPSLPRAPTVVVVPSREIGIPRGGAEAEGPQLARGAKERDAKPHASGANRERGGRATQRGGCAPCRERISRLFE